MYLHVQRIRDFFDNALYKFTFYLLTYLPLALSIPFHQIQLGGLGERCKLPWGS